MSTNEAAERLRKYMRGDWDYGITLLDEALAHERSAGQIDVETLAKAMAKHSLDVGFGHSTDSCGAGCARFVAAEYARLEATNR